MGDHFITWRVNGTNSNIGFIRNIKSVPANYGSYIRKAFKSEFL